MSTTTLPPTPSITTIPSTKFPPTPTMSSVPPAQQQDSTYSPVSQWTSLPSDPSSGLSNPTMPAAVMMSTVAHGIFGVGVNFDPLIIVGLVLAALIFLLLLGALIYCCCTGCGATTRHPVVKQNASFQTIRQQRQPARPVYLTASFAPEYSSSAGVRTVARRQYLYPADVVGVGNDVTYNTIRPTIISRGTPITALGDGYAIGHSLRSAGNNYGSRNLLLYDDDPPQIITIY